MVEENHDVDDEEEDDKELLALMGQLTHVHSLKQMVTHKAASRGASAMSAHSDDASHHHQHHPERHNRQEMGGSLGGGRRDVYAEMLRESGGGRGAKGMVDFGWEGDVGGDAGVGIPRRRARAAMMDSSPVTLHQFVEAKGRRGGGGLPTEVGSTGRNEKEEALRKGRAHTVIGGSVVQKKNKNGRVAKSVMQRQLEREGQVSSATGMLPPAAFAKMMMGDGGGRKGGGVGRAKQAWGGQDDGGHYEEDARAFGGGGRGALGAAFSMPDFDDDDDFGHDDGDYGVGGGGGGGEGVFLPPISRHRSTSFIDRPNRMFSR